MRNIVSILIIIASIGIFFGYIKPIYGTIKAQRSQLASYKDTIKQANELEQRVVALQAKARALDPKATGKLEKLLPDTVSNVNLIIDINTIAEKSGLGIRDIQLSQAAGGNKGSSVSSAKETDPKNALYDSIDLTFSVNASYPTFLSFASDLERSLRLVDITNISFKPSDTSDKYNFKVTLRTYWLK